MGLGRGTRVLLLALAVVIAGAGITQAATTISTNISTAGTLSVTDQTTLGNATSTVFTAYNAFFGTSATTTIDTAGNLSVLGTLKVGTAGTQTTRIVAGYCVTGSITIPATNASSTQTYANCTPSGGTSVITSGDRVFVQATSSLPYYVNLQSASSTATGGLITVGLTNHSTSTSPAAAVYAFNFWAFQ